MKIIEGLKKVKDLEKKANDLRHKIGRHCALSSLQTPEYGDRQQAQVSEWLQAHRDVVKEILNLRVAIQRTNMITNVVVELGGKSVTRTIAEWIHRRRDLARLDYEAYSMLTDRGIAEEGWARDPSGDQVQVKIVRFYDPAARDKMLEEFASEASLIDGRLEIANAVTDLID